MRRARGRSKIWNRAGKISRSFSKIAICSSKSKWKADRSRPIKSGSSAGMGPNECLPIPSTVIRTLEILSVCGWRKISSGPPLYENAAEIATLPGGAPSADAPGRIYPPVSGAFIRNQQKRYPTIAGAQHLPRHQMTHLRSVQRQASDAGGVMAEAGGVEFMEGSILDE